jgi:hypothetical protein
VQLQVEETKPRAWIAVAAAVVLVAVTVGAFKLFVKRPSVLTGKDISNNNSAARAAYEEFLQLWKHADPDIPILKQAKAEYAKLQ